MQYYIPTDEQIITALRKVFSDYRTIQSQRRLKVLVEKQLKSLKKQYHVSEGRLRKLVLTKKLARVEIHSREGDPHKVLVRCPVCDSHLNRVKNLTIWGGEVTLEFRCSFCGYWTGKKKRIPTLYVFHKT